MKNFKYVLIGLVTFALTSSAFAKKGSPVPHKHGSRTHTHSLPNSGVNHNHSGNKKSNTKAQSSWIHIATSASAPKNSYYGKKYSVVTSNGKVSAIGKINYVSGTIKVYKWSIPLAHCNNGMGVITWHKISGKYNTQTDFVFDSGNIASAIAKKICASR